MGIPADFQTIYAGELAYVVRTLQRLGVAAGDLEDAAQEVFVVVYRRRADRDPARPLRPWLFGIAYRVVGNYRQKAHRRREVGAEVDARDPRPSPEESATHQQERARLLAALASLDLDDRAVAILYELEERTAPEIAEALGIPLNTVYSRARSARLRLIEAARRLRGGP
jgi:RNA polymerase sigma-70 factor (ECF subfamily)